MDNKQPTQPSSLLVRLCKLGTIVSIEANLRMTSGDSGHTVWKVMNASGQTVSDEARRIIQLIDFDPLGSGALAEVKREKREIFDAYAKWEKANAKELSEYRRLKAKFGGL